MPKTKRDVSCTEFNSICLTHSVLMADFPSLFPGDNLELFEIDERGKTGRSLQAIINKISNKDDNTWLLELKSCEVIDNTDDVHFKREPQNFDDAVAKILGDFQEVFIGKHHDYGPDNILRNQGVSLVEGLATLIKQIEEIEDRVEALSLIRKFVDSLDDVSEETLDNSPARLLAVQTGLLLRIGDKVSRLKTLLARSAVGDDPKNESIEDTYRDFIGYGLIGVMLLQGQFELPLKDDW